MRLIVAAVVVLLPAVSHAQKITGRADISAIRQYYLAEQRAQMAYEKDVKSARDKLIDKLESSLKKATQAGKFDEANALNDTIKDLKSKGIKAQSSSGLRNIVGTWRTQISGKAIPRVYVVSPTGSVILTTDNQKYTGTVKAKDGAVFFDFKDGDIDRVTIIGNRIFIEHWRGALRGIADTVQSGYRVK